MTDPENRFQAEPDEVLPDDGAAVPEGWSVDTPDPESADVDQLLALLNAHEEAGRGWAGAGRDTVLTEISEDGTRTRANVVLRDRSGRIRAWGSVHDRSHGRMLFVHIVGRTLSQRVAERCAHVLVLWAEGQARAVGAARGLDEQQIDTGAFAGDEWHRTWLRDTGFRHTRTWWQMSRPVTADEADEVSDIDHWQDGGLVVRQVRREGSGMPDESDLRAVHDVLESAFADHFNSSEETFAEFLHRLRHDPGHRWDHWWLAELTDLPDTDGPTPVGALVGAVSEGGEGEPDGSYVDYLGVLSIARGRGVAKGLLNTIIADAARRDRDRVGLEVDADSPTGADGLYTSMGWKTKYITESWHRDVPVTATGE